MFVERKFYHDWLWSLKDQNLIKVLTGVRRVGKSTIFQMFGEKLEQERVPKNRIFFFNFEELETIQIGDYLQFYNHLKEKLDPNNMNYVFLDEVQNLENFERLVDGLYVKNNIDLYVTGSNSYFLSGELATLLTGRSIEKHVLPFSFYEYKQLLKKEDDLSNDLFRRYLFEGGIPQSIALSKINPKESENFLEGVLDTIINKDIFPRQKFYNKADFNGLTNFILDSIGSIVSPNSISKTLKNNKISLSEKTVRKYLQDLCDSFLFYHIERYDIKGKQLLRTLGKYYCVDNGFRRVTLSKSLGDDEGHLLENAVFIELKRRFKKVYIGKANEKEVDFFCMDFDNRFEYFQVSLNTLDKNTLKRELEAFDEIKDNFPKTLITVDEREYITEKGINVVNAKKWFLENK